MKIATIVGARPQFIKAVPVSREIRKHHKEILIHTGQHYDTSMSDIFFHELELPQPDYNLGVGSGHNGEQTGKMLIRIEDALRSEEPDMAIVYGDTNSTLAGALAAVKMHIPVMHIEAGLRSFNKSMPEEINRIVTDHISEHLMAPTATAMHNLAVEGLAGHLVGDVMADALEAHRSTGILNDLGFDAGSYIVLTMHRPVNSDNRERRERIFGALAKCGKPIIFPTHPRIAALYRREHETKFKSIFPLPPVGYSDMIELIKSAYKIVTDSGGVQKECYMLKVPCLTLRAETEWRETLACGWNVLVDADPEKIARELAAPRPLSYDSKVFSTGASKRIAGYLGALCRS